MKSQNYSIFFLLLKQINMIINNLLKCKIIFFGYLFFINFAMDMLCHFGFPIKTIFILDKWEKEC